MDIITKNLKKLTPKEQKIFRQLLERIQNGNFGGLDMKKLVGHDNIYRVRKGKYRILFRVEQEGEIYILAFERRSEKTYRQH